MNYQEQISKLLQDIGPGRMRSTAYDTAWVARLTDLGEPIGQQALEWLRENQLPDGSWGAREPRYYHDRLISTLAAMIALGRWGNAKDAGRLRRAVLGMDISLRGLRADPVGETVGFEMIVPALLAEINTLGILSRKVDTDIAHLGLYPSHGETDPDSRGQRYDELALNTLGAKRIQKLQGLPKGKINRHITVAFSAEMAGKDGIQTLDVGNLQEANGSVGHSPSATAYFVTHVRPEDQAGMLYLRQNINEDGGAPDVAPFDTFERAWTLWNLSLAAMDDETKQLCQRHLDFLEKAWVPGVGTSFAAEYTPKDSDDSGLIFDVLARYGRKMDVDAILRYEKDDHFRCFDLESNPSISANIHVLGALSQAGFEISHPSVQKVLKFLHRTRYLETFWFDKWHASPYYPTAHAILAAESYIQDPNKAQQSDGILCASELEQNAVDWILSTQNADGSWGFYGPTSEETAYSLQALLILRRNGKQISTEAIKRGLGWLEEHMQPPYPPLWIGKSLYCPTLVVSSAILSALSLGTQEQ